MTPTNEQKNLNKISNPEIKKAEENSLTWTAEDLSLIHISEPTRPY